MQDDFRAGQISATVANYAGKMRSDKAPQARASDFMPSIATLSGEPEPDKPRLLDDPAEHAAFIKKTIFGKDG